MCDDLHKRWKCIVHVLAEFHSGKYILLALPE